MGRLDGIRLPRILGDGGCLVYLDTGSQVGHFDGVGLPRRLGDGSSGVDDEGSPVDKHWEACLATVGLKMDQDEHSLGGMGPDNLQSVVCAWTSVGSAAAGS